MNELGQDVNQFWQAGQLTEIPGVGKAIAEKIDELLTTGEQAFLNKLSVGVTLEPAGGSPGPTGPKVLGGEL